MNLLADIDLSYADTNIRLSIHDGKDDKVMLEHDARPIPNLPSLVYLSFQFVKIPMKEPDKFQHFPSLLPSGVQCKKTASLNFCTPDPELSRAFKRLRQILSCRQSL